MQYVSWHTDFVLVEYLPIFAIILFIYEGTALSENKAGKLMSAVFQSPWNAGLHHPFRSYWVEPFGDWQGREVGKSDQYQFYCSHRI